MNLLFYKKTYFLLFLISSDLSAQNSPLNFYQSIISTDIEGIIDGEVSGVTWNPLINSLYLINDENGIIWETDTSLNILRTITGADFGDTEDIIFLTDNKYAIVTEEGLLYVGNILNGSDDYEVNPNLFQEISFSTSDNNSGPEGVAYNSIDEIIYIVKEKNPMAIFRFELPNTDLDTTIIPEIPFNAQSLFDNFMEDLSAITFDSRTGRLLILSDDSKRIIDVHPESGAIYGVLDLEEDHQYEGLTFYDNHYNLIVTSEPNLYVKYERPCASGSISSHTAILCLADNLLFNTQDCGWDIDFNQTINIIDLLISSDILSGFNYYNCSNG